MRLPLVILFLLPLAAQAQVYKCTDNSGRVVFSDQPCAGQYSGGPIEVQRKAPVTTRTEAIHGPSSDDLERSLYVEIPALERQAQQAMDSGDPLKVRIGEEMAWRARQQRVAIERVKAARAQQTETKQKYERALQEIGR
jgi:hypothetical protein